MLTMWRCSCNLPLDSPAKTSRHPAAMDCFAFTRYASKQLALESSESRRDMSWLYMTSACFSDDNWAERLSLLARSDSTDHNESPSRSSFHGSSGHYFLVNFTSCVDDVENLGGFFPSHAHVESLSSNRNSQQQDMAMCIAVRTFAGLSNGIYT